MIIIDDFNNPNPEIDQILPYSIGELLLRKVCPPK